MTDAPGCGYDAVNVTITDVSVHQSSTAAATDAGWVHVPITAQKINLLNLQNGVLATLGQTPLPAGNYTQMRLLLASNSGMTLANSVVPTGGSEVALKTPSGQQTGLKMNVDIKIAPDQMADFVVDFNACKSVVSAGASGMYLLKPVVSVTPNFISGVRGMVDASIDGGTGANTQIMLEQPGTSTQPPLVIRATTPDANGNYLLQPVAPGIYDLVVTSNGHATAVVTGVVVQSQLVTTIPGAINPPLSAVGGQGGTVTTGVTPVDAALVAQQTLTAGGTIEVAFTAADTVLGHLFVHVAGWRAGGRAVCRRHVDVHDGRRRGWQVHDRRKLGLDDAVLVACSSSRQVPTRRWISPSRNRRPDRVTCAGRFEGAGAFYFALELHGRS